MTMLPRKLFAFVLMASCLICASAQGQLKTKGIAAGQSASLFHIGVPQKPLPRDRHTLLLATFDSATSGNADYARFDAVNTGRKTRFGGPGRMGGAVQFADLQSSIVYRGTSNYCAEHGTAEMWLRSSDQTNVWNDGKVHWLLILLPDAPFGHPGRQPYTLEVFKNARNEVELRVYPARVPLYAAMYPWMNRPAVLTLPAASLERERWHHLLVGWDMRGAGRAWLAVDGAGAEASLKLPSRQARAVPGAKIYLGANVFPTFDGHLPWAGWIDDLCISSLTPPQLAADRDRRPDERENRWMHGEDLVRSWLDAAQGLQVGGGWEAWYEWPAMRPGQFNWALQNADDFSSEKVGACLLRAHELWEDQRYLRAAVQVGEMFLHAQSPAGAWVQYHAVTPQGLMPENSCGNIEEQTQSMPIRFLAYLHRITGDERYREACRRAGGFLLACQDKTGWWPWGYDFQRHKIIGHGGPTLNDDAHGRTMEDMLVLYHITRETKYLDALRRAADWLADKAFVRKGACRGWAEQYDMSSQPCWGRGMEPPSVSMTATGYAVPRLLLLYDLTADPKYLKPVEECVAWGRSLPERRRGWLYYDLDSGEPIMAYNKRIFSVFSEEFKQQFPKFSAHFSSGRAGYPFESYAAWHKQRDQGPAFPSWKGVLPRRLLASARPTREELKRRAASWPAGSVKALEDWQAGKLGDILINLDEYASLMFNMSTSADHAANLLDTIAAARTAAGDVPVESFPHYGRAALGNAALIAPGRDWYDTPLGPTKGLLGR
jgi:hypothetical protein